VSPTFTLMLPGCRRPAAREVGEPVDLVDEVLAADHELARSRDRLPRAPTEPPDVEGLTRLAASFGIEIVGPHGIPA